MCSFCIGRCVDVYLDVLVAFVRINAWTLMLGLMHECINPIHLGCPHCVWWSKLDSVANLYFPIIELGNWKKIIINFWSPQFITEIFWSPTFNCHSRRLNFFGLPNKNLGVIWNILVIRSIMAIDPMTKFFVIALKSSIVAQIS